MGISVEDHVAVQRLMYRYASCADRKDYDGWAAAGAHGWDFDVDYIAHEKCLTGGACSEDRMLESTTPSGYRCLSRKSAAWPGVASERAERIEQIKFDDGADRVCNDDRTRTEQIDPKLSAESLHETAACRSIKSDGADL